VGVESKGRDYYTIAPGKGTKTLVISAAANWPRAVFCAEFCRVRRRPFDSGRRYIVHSDELLSAFIELEAALL
jgi:hypothetical protein